MSKLGADGFQAALDPIVPAVTCSVQATFADRPDAGRPRHRRQRLVLPRPRRGLPLAPAQQARAGREGLGDRAPRQARLPRREPRAGGTRWARPTDLTVTPRPIYHADGRKSPDCYTYPPQLHDNLTGPLGEFPLFQYWGPTANIKSTKWIADAAKIVLDNEQLDLLLVYLPHLDYDHQRFGPEGTGGAEGGAELDEVARRPDRPLRARAATRSSCCSEYGITEAKRPVEINRALRRAGLLNVYTQAGMEYLDPWTSRAFAVSDHQIAHVYVANPADLPAAREAIAALDGVGEMLEGESLAAAGLSHERSGELVVLAERDAWFTYHYWLDNAHAPDFGRQVEIHRKPGYDPAELFLDPDDEKGAKLRGGLALARKKAGMRYVLSVVGLDASKYVKGTHGLLPPGDEDGPVFLCSEALARA